MSDLNRTFCLTLLRAARAWRRIADAAATAHGLSDATAYPLVLLRRHGEGLRQTALAEMIGIEGPSLVRLLDQLGAAGLVERREDPSDKRAKTLHLTPKGRGRAEALTADLDAVRADVFAPLRPGDLEAALRVLAVVEAAATRPAGAPEPVP